MPDSKISPELAVFLRESIREAIKSSGPFVRDIEEALELADRDQSDSWDGVVRLALYRNSRRVAETEFELAAAGAAASAFPPNVDIPAGWFYRSASIMFEQNTEGRWAIYQTDLPAFEMSIRRRNGEELVVEVSEDRVFRFDLDPRNVSELALKLDD